MFPVQPRDGWTPLNGSDNLREGVSGLTAERTLPSGEVIRVECGADGTGVFCMFRVRPHEATGRSGVKSCSASRQRARLGCVSLREPQAAVRRAVVPDANMPGSPRCDAILRGRQHGARLLRKVCIYAAAVFQPDD